MFYGMHGGMSDICIQNIRNGNLNIYAIFDCW